MYSTARLLEGSCKRRNSDRYLVFPWVPPSPLTRLSSFRQHRARVSNIQFPGHFARRLKPGHFSRRVGNPRFVLFPLPRDDAPPAARNAATLLPPPSGMHSYVQVVGTPTADTPGACLMLHFDNRRYLFGRIAEGTQRLMIQRKVSLARVHDIFVTGRIGWESVGGLLGMILTLAELKAASQADNERNNKGKRDAAKAAAENILNVHGGKNLVHMLATARSFIFRKALPVRPREIVSDPQSDGAYFVDPDYEDENIRVWSIAVSAGEATELVKKRKRSLTEAIRGREFEADEDDGEGPAGADTAMAGAEAEADKNKDKDKDKDKDKPAARPPPEKVDQDIREAVVKDMFGSKWRLDTLRELPLSEVRLPAKIFVRDDKGFVVPWTGPMPSKEEDWTKINVMVRTPWPASQVEQLPATEPSKQTVCYIVKTHPRRGKFDVATATSLGVVKTDFKRLTNGETVTGKDGVVVTPEMVLGPSVPGCGFAIIDIPSPRVVKDVLRRPEWSDKEIMNGIDVIYWIFSDSVAARDPRVIDFIRNHSSVKHVMLGSGESPNLLALQSHAAQLIQMNGVDPDRFRLPVFNNDSESTLRVGKSGIPVAEIARPGTRFQLAPKVGFQPEYVIPVMDTTRPINELSAQAPHVLELAAAARRKISDPAFLAEVEESQKDLPDPDTEIITLGTGSAMPSKYRNVSANLIRVPGRGSYLLDCGENTLGQLRRCLGFDGADEVLRDLRAIYISHAHADHHLGVVNVIARWAELHASGAPPDRKLAVVAPPKYQQFLLEFQGVQALCPDRLVQIALRPNGRYAPNTYLRTSLPERDGKPIALDLPMIEACAVDHCFEASAVVLTFLDSGLKIAYSGDCRPSSLFASIGYGAHLLLHECTFEDELAADAVAKKHSTLSEALAVGRDMRARRIILTHFSQRYPKLPVVSEEALKGGAAASGGGADVGDGSDGSDAEKKKADDGEKKEAGKGKKKASGVVKEEEEEEEERDVEVLCAFDMMRVKLGEFKQAKEFVPALRELLREGEREDEKEEKEAEK